MPQDERELTSPREPSTGESTTEGAPNDLQSQNTKLRQENARAKEIMRQAHPIALLGEKLQNAEGGAAIIKKLEKGIPLTAEDKAVAKEAAGPVTEERIKEILDESNQNLEQRMFAGRKAEQEMDTLHKRAIKEFPGYENVYRSPEFKRLQNYVLADVQNDPSIVPPGEDIGWWIQAETWKTLKAKNPEMLERPAGKSEEERQGEIAGQATTRSGGAPDATQDKDEIPGYVKNLGTRRYGGRLSDLRPKS